MSDVTRQVKHPPTCTIHSPFTRENKKFFFVKSKMCANIRHTMHICLSVWLAVVNLVVEVWREKGYKQTAALAMWWNHA